jgi:hypothetical protein
MSLSTLRELLNQQFDTNELRQLCFDLSIEYENLPGETRATKAQALIEHCLRHQLLPELLQRCTQLRPKTSWPSAELFRSKQDGPITSPITGDVILKYVQASNAELRDYPDEIVGIHIDRPEVAQIIEWIYRPDVNKECLGVVLDQPGSGKTVVMHDVLVQLEKDGIPVLAVKADFLSGIRTHSELADRLGLPAAPEECARHLAERGLCVVLLDQLDALSLSLSRDQTTLDIMLSTLTRLRNLDNVRIVVSCRTFDLNNDPKLSQIKVDRKFSLLPLSDEEIDRVLQAIGIQPVHLLPAHRALLATPLHLEVYARIMAANSPGQLPERFYSLQELYQALWRKRIEVVPPDSPTPTERIEAIYRLVEVMQHNSQITAPIAALDDHVAATTYLERVGFIRREGNNWLFFHQTLLDYCYARRFMAKSHSLSQQIFHGSQGLFERSQMVQILAYLRGADETAYHRELRALLFTDRVRTHLHLLLIGWFGSLPVPTAIELQVARQVIRDSENGARFFRAISGNGGWFELLGETIIPAMLRSRDEQQVNLAVGFLATLVEQRTDDVLVHLKPFLGSSEAWDDRIVFCLSNVKSWQSDESVELLCDFFRRRRTFNREDHFLHSLQTNPSAGCRVLRIYLDLRLDDIVAQLQIAEDGVPEPEKTVKLHDRLNWERHLLGEHGVGDMLERAVQVCPERVLESILPWFVRATTTLNNPRYSEDDYPYEYLFALHWYGDHPSEGASFARQMAAVLHKLAEENSLAFRTLAEALAQVESLAVQRVLVAAYLPDPAEYADDIFNYLTADSRRLNIGEPWESAHYDSYRLLAVVFPYLEEAQQRALEVIILALHPAWERRDLGRQGITQLHFLQALPIDLLGEKARRRRQELEHKFPDFRLRPPQGVTGGAVGPPIAQESQGKMSDEAWLSAMHKYDDDTEWDGPNKDFLKGGVIELSRSFTERVKQEPERFYHLAQRFDEAISSHYVAAAISGLAESEAPPEWVFDLVRRFAHRLEGEFRRYVCWALSKRAEDGVPDDILDLLTEWALHDPDPQKELWRITANSGQPSHGGDPHQHGINTNRGAAIRAVAHTALKRTPPQVERLFTLLEGVSANDPSTAVRACVLEILGPLLNQNAERTLAIFDRTLVGHPALLQSPLVYRFLYWVYREHFGRIRPYIELVLAYPDDSTRQAGARLACLAAFIHPEAKELAEHAFAGDEDMRRGAAQVYARNLAAADISDICRQHLEVLMHDPDEEVRKEVGRCFEDLRPEQLGELRPFVEAFLNSPALSTGARHLINYLKPLIADEHELALQVTERMLDITGTTIVDIRTSVALYERDLVHLPLTVYIHASDLEIKARAMTLFEQLLLLDSRAAHQALSDWDRQ